MRRERFQRRVDPFHLCNRHGRRRDLPLREDAFRHQFPGRLPQRVLKALPGLPVAAPGRQHDRRQHDRRRRRECDPVVCHHATPSACWHEGDHAVTTRVEHNSVLRPLAHLERDRGVRVTRVGSDAWGYVDPDALRDALRPGARVVVVSHGSNVLGSVQDLAALAARAREAGALFVVDTAQSAGVLPIDMDRLGIDLLCFTGHKGLLGPMGIGGMIVAEGVELGHARVGGTGVDSFLAFQPDAYPHRLEAGTLSIPGIAGLNAAQKWFAELGRTRPGGAPGEDHATACRRALAHIASVELGHLRRIEDALVATGGVTVYGPRGKRPRVATLSFNLAGLPAEQVGEMLDADHHVCVRAGLHCAPLVHEDQGTAEAGGAVRIAPGYFTDDEDLEHALGAIAALAG